MVKNLRGIVGNHFVLMSNQLVKLAQEKAELRDQNEVMMKRLKKEEDELQGLEQAMALLKKSNNDYRYNYLNVRCIYHNTSI